MARNRQYNLEYIRTEYRPWHHIKDYDYNWLESVAMLFDRSSLVGRRARALMAVYDERTFSEAGREAGFSARGVAKLFARLRAGEPLSQIVGGK